MAASVALPPMAKPRAVPNAPKASGSTTWAYAAVVIASKSGTRKALTKMLFVFISNPPSSWWRVAAFIIHRKLVFEMTHFGLTFMENFYIPSYLLSHDRTREHLVSYHPGTIPFSADRFRSGEQNPFFSPFSLRKCYRARGVPRRFMSSQG
jgi:hypothetical protein